MLIFSWFMGILFLIIGVVNGITPYYSRLGTPFGVTVPTSHQKDPYVLKLKKAYLYQNVIGSILLAAPIFFFLFLKLHKNKNIIYFLPPFMSFNFFCVSIIC